ncbi:tRNA lysidine(34) synthetase [Methanotorris igneus]|uniref:PP-loop domain protein n=1 Tax=Methanotorris igneus (strain DSM 5666 / JCM 11834 / Kol 5) TaxID=880724 RepID=F6BBJ8_METIK|nr:tRNA 2-thiocytidine biosynthesis TtcA family protein [Methanotorris igneus]AEF96007.1 PP-loop domain protein [Methanotorris igneus Kol 5]
MIDIKQLKRYANPSYLTIREDKILVCNKREARLSREKMNKIEEEFGIPVIYSRTYEEVSKKVGRFIIRNKIINPRDIIVVGLSGGKDSLMLLHLLEPYRRKYGIDIHAITVDLNVDGIRPWSEDREGMKLIKDHCKKLNIPHKVLKCDKNVVELSRILSENDNGIEYSPCFSCSIIRRHLLTKYADSLKEKEGRDVKIAFGHTLEDNSDTVLANILKGCAIKALKPIKQFYENVVDYKYFKITLKPCTIIRPLLPVSEKSIIKALNECGIEYYRDKDECPYSRNRGDNIRRRAHEVLSLLEKEVKNVREMVVSAAIKSENKMKKSEEKENEVIDE